MEKTYLLNEHEFLASSKMDALYVIKTNVSMLGSNPEIIDTFPMAAQGDNAPGISVRLFTLDGDLMLEIASGDTLRKGSYDLVRSGRVIVETAGSISQSGETVRRVNTYLNSAKVDADALAFVAGGIGISDILSGDPLIVDLVSAPLSQLKDVNGVERAVRGIYIEYVDMAITSYSVGTQTAKIWGFQTILEPIAL